MGLDLFTGQIKNMIEIGVIEPYQIKYYSLLSATEAAISIIRINQILIQKNIDKQIGSEI